MPYTPILNMAHILESTLYLIDHTDYPHKGHPALEHVRQSLREALASIKELEPLQSEVSGAAIPADAPKPARPETPEPTPIDSARHKRP